MTARPTARRPALAAQPARIPLDETDHPVLRKAAEQFAVRDTPHERIASTDDVIPFKVKTGRWRGAVFPGQPADDAQD